jgi:ElaB/YqjD/DUF883 family membrane-anchored ribosome-binding protein
MDMATFLKRCANLFMAVTVVRLVAGDLSAEVRADAAILKRRVGAALRESPYLAAGAATATGLIAGALIGNRRRA